MDIIDNLIIYALMYYRYNKEIKMNKKQKAENEVLDNLVSFRVSKKQLETLNNLRQDNYINLSAVFRMCLDRAIEEIKTKK